MGKALVTGANGHIGANVVRELVEHGYDVVALVREGSDVRGLEGLAVTIARGDVLDATSVERAIAGCDQVFHLAAPYAVWAKRPEDIIEPAVRGTENVLRAAKAAGVKRVVVTGSCNAVGFTTGAPLDETTMRASAKSPYMRAKLEQERTATRLAKELGLEVVVVLPTTVLGPYDFKKTPTTAPFVDALKGKGPVPFAMNLVDVRDVATGHRLAMERGRPGERYLIGGENVEIDRMAEWIEKHTGKRPAKGLPPPWVLRIVATLMEAASAVTGKAPMLTRDVLDDAGGGAPLFDIGKAKRDLGYAPRGGEEVVVATMEWAKKMGWL